MGIESSFNQERKTVLDNDASGTRQRKGIEIVMSGPNRDAKDKCCLTKPHQRQNQAMPSIFWLWLRNLFLKDRSDNRICQILPLKEQEVLFFLLGRGTILVVFHQFHEVKVFWF